MYSPGAVCGDIVSLGYTNDYLGNAVAVGYAQGFGLLVAMDENVAVLDGLSDIRSAAPASQICTAELDASDMGKLILL